MSTLREHQERAIAEVRAHFAARRKRVLLVAPTGSGKTHTAAVLIGGAVARGHRVLFLVHRREIILDTARRLRAAGLRVGLVMADERPDAGAPVQLLSVQTAAARGVAPPGELLIWDEAHHVAARTYRAIAAKYPAAWHLGLTATPQRADGAGLGDAFDAIVVGATVAELTAEGYLAPCDALCPPAIGAGQIALDPVDAVARYAPGRRAVVFTRTVEHARECAARGGRRWDYVDGATDPEARAYILTRFARGEIDALCNVYVLTEGTDLPTIDTVVLARGFSAAGPYLQATGRGLRADPARPDKRLLLLDLARNVVTHGLPDADREFALGDRPIVAKGPAVALCRPCGAVRQPDARVCWRCHAPYPPPPRLAVVNRELAKVAAVRPATPEERAAALAEITATARERGYRRGWAAHRYRARFGEWPDWRALNTLLAGGAA